MEDELFEAATYGDVEALRDIIRNDALILGKFVAGCFTWSPFLVAASQGHVSFVDELLILNPKLAHALDSQNRSALHLSAAEGHIEVVKKLLTKLGINICVIRDQHGQAPIHVAAINGEVVVVEVLLRACFDMARAKLDRDKTILHLCVTHHQFVVLKLLLSTLKDKEFVNAKDDCGNTVLHMAVYQKQVQVIEYLLCSSLIDVNAKNINGQTALDILFILNITAKSEEIEELKSIKEILLKAYGKRGKSIANFNWLERKDVLILVASVFATSSFQAALNPPGGVWQDSFNGHTAGEPILFTHNPQIYHWFLMANTLTFLISIMCMFVITYPFLSHEKSLVLYLGICNTFVIFSMGITYAISTITVSLKPNGSTKTTLFMFTSHINSVRIAYFVIFVAIYCVLVVKMKFGVTNQYKERRRGNDVLARVRGVSPNSNQVQAAIQIQAE